MGCRHTAILFTDEPDCPAVLVWAEVSSPISTSTISYTYHKRKQKRNVQGSLEKMDTKGHWQRLQMKRNSSILIKGCPPSGFLFLSLHLTLYIYLSSLHINWYVTTPIDNCIYFNTLLTYDFFEVWLLHDYFVDLNVLSSYMKRALVLDWPILIGVMTQMCELL